MLSAAIIDGLAQSALFHGLPGDALGDVAALVRPALPAVVRATLLLDQIQGDCGLV